MSDREEALSDFKSCTGIRDDAKAIFYLEAANWDLLEAISKVVPNDTQKLPSEVNSSDISIPDDSIEIINNPSENNGNDFASDVRENPPRKVTRFVITNDNDNIKCQSVYKFVLSDNETIRHLKELIQCKSEIPPCHQLLVGWPGAEPCDDDKVGRLNLPEIVNLNVLNIVSVGNGPTPEVNEDRIYTLVIRNEVTGGTYQVTYNGSKSIRDVKHGVADVTNISYNRQIWTGWPENTNDYTTLASSGISYPEHNLSVNFVGTNNVTENNNKATNTNSLRSDSEGSIEEYTPIDDDELEEEHDDDHDIDDINSVDDGDDMSFEPELPTRNNWQPLIPEQFENESVASYCFSYEFENRYGGLHPQFFIGTFDEALRESCFRPARERKLLAVYLHHDDSILTNVFCTQLLCFDSVIQYLANNFVLWGWDLTRDSNKDHLLRIMGEKLGPLAAALVRSTKIERMPIILIITRVRGNTEIVTTISGNITLNELISSLIQAVDIFTEQKSVEVNEEEDRERRELIKVEQDEAYRQSLENDRAKEEAKRNEEKLEKEKQAQIDNAKREENAKKEATRQLLLSRLPPEPKVNDESVTKIRIRLPTSEIIERKFLVGEKFQVLLDYLVVNGYDTVEYKLCTSFPRRDLTVCSPDSTLKDLKLFPQETLVIERC